MGENAVYGSGRHIQLARKESLLKIVRDVL